MFWHDAIEWQNVAYVTVAYVTMEVKQDEICPYTLSFFSNIVYLSAEVTNDNSKAIFSNHGRYLHISHGHYIFTKS